MCCKFAKKNVWLDGIEGRAESLQKEHRLRPLAAQAVWRLDEPTCTLHGLCFSSFCTQAPVYLFSLPTTIRSSVFVTIGLSVIGRNSFFFFFTIEDGFLGTGVMCEVFQIVGTLCWSSDC